MGVKEGAWFVQLADGVSAYMGVGARVKRILTKDMPSPLILNDFLIIYFLHPKLLILWM
jgi:hypothetical protein